MQRCKIKFCLTGKTEIKVQSGEEDTLDVLIEELEEGRAPSWLEQMLVNGINWEDIELEEVKILGGEPGAEEELDFDTD